MRALFPAAPGLREAIDGFAVESVRPVAAAVARGEGPDAGVLLRQAAGRGLAGILIPEAYGGRGGHHTDFVAFIAAVAAECASTSVILDVHGTVGTEPILGLGDDHQRREFLPRLARGEWLAAFALTEPDSGSDAAALATRAVRDGAGYRLSGTKSFITNSGLAAVYTVYARTSAGRAGITAFLVKAETPGVSAGPPLRKMGLRGSRTGDLILDGALVPAGYRLGAEGAGFAIAMSTLDSGRVGIAAQAVGIAQGALDCAVGHVRGHRWGGDETAIADMRASVAAAAALTLEAARLLDAGEPATGAASVAKLVATDSCMAVADAAVDLCSPESVDEGHPATIRWRDAKALQIYEGTNQIQRRVIARGLLG